MKLQFSFRWVRAAAVASLAVALGTFSGCSSKNAATPANFQTGLNKYFAERHLDCLFDGNQKFPYVTTDPAEEKKFDVMTKEQLFTAKHEPQDARYDTTPYGQSQAPMFCYGQRSVTSVDSFTPPAKGASGFNESMVTYHYSMENVPVWAKSDDMKKIFPEMAKNASGNATGTIRMAQTAVGWQVPE